MYKSKYSNLINHLTNDLDLILLDSEIQNIENLIDKDLQAINYTRCCMSEAEQLKCSGCKKPLNDGLCGSCCSDLASGNY